MFFSQIFGSARWPVQQKSLKFGDQIGLFDAGKGDFEILLCGPCRCFLISPLLLQSAQVEGDIAGPYLCEPALPMAVARNGMKGLDFYEIAPETPKVVQGAQFA